MARLLAFLILLCVLADEPAKPAPWVFRDIEGRTHEPFDKQETRAIVVVFITTDCPIANYYQPLLARMEKKYAKRGVAFFLCHAATDLTLAEVRKHQRDFRISVPVILDRDQRVAHRLDALVTPEAFVIDAQGKQVYRGRIDDLYADFGKRRPVARSHDLQNALDALLQGKPVPEAKTKAIGCYISYANKPASRQVDK